MKARFGSLVFVLAAALVLIPAFADTPPQITRESSWYFQGVPCGTTAQECKAAAVAAAQASPGTVEQVFGPPYDVSVPASGGTSPPPPCTNMGAMQPGDYYDANGNPVFADPCHGK